MKVYVVYESYYGELTLDTGDSTCIIGVYDNIEKAREKIKSRVDYDLQNNFYVLDNECDNEINENGGYFRLFYNEQENWGCYYEIIAKVKEVE